MFCVNLFSQNAIKFDYDASGNMTHRYIQVVALRLAKPVKDSVLNFNIYPIPAKEQITIEGPLDNNIKEAQVLLYNINGGIVKQDTYNGTKKTYPLTGFTTGIYFLEIKYSKSQSSSYRIIITE